jgi:hypothetical protein
VDGLPGDADREALRQRLLAEIPRWYSPAFHVAVPSLFGLAVIAFALTLLERPMIWAFLTVPIVWVFANLNEWRIHRDLLHRRHPLAPVLYEQHTPRHHRLYVTHDMRIRDRRELRLVLIPAYGIMLLFVITVPVGAVLWLLGLRNVAVLYVATAMAYVLSYEWLHLAYHTKMGDVWPISLLRRHHAIHHDLRLMQRWNLNVTVPLADWLLGTLTTTSLPDRAQRDAA